MVRCCGLTQHYFLEVRFHLSPFGSRFEDPFLDIFVEHYSGFCFGYCYRLVHVTDHPLQALSPK